VIVERHVTLSIRISTAYVAYILRRVTLRFVSLALARFTRSILVVARIVAPLRVLALGVAVAAVSRRFLIASHSIASYSTALYFYCSLRLSFMRNFNQSVGQSAHVAIRSAQTHIDQLTSLISCKQQQYRYAIVHYVRSSGSLYAYATTTQRFVSD